MSDRIYLAASLHVLGALDSEMADLVYMKPPSRLTVTRSDPTQPLVTVPRRNRPQYLEGQDEYLEFVRAFTVEAYRLLTRTGSLYFHSTPDEVHYCKVFVLDKIFGRENFRNEIIWARQPVPSQITPRSYPKQHDTILLYTKTSHYAFNADDVDRIPYMAPDLVTAAKQNLGKLPTDTWWDTLTPEGIETRIIRASTRPNGLVIDPFAREGAIGKASLRLERRFILIEGSPEFQRKLRQEFSNEPEIEWISPSSNYSDMG